MLAVQVSEIAKQSSLDECASSARKEGEDARTAMRFFITVYELSQRP
jgi:hypothetical protein